MLSKSTLLRGMLGDLDKAQRKLRPYLVKMTALLSNATAFAIRAGSTDFNSWGVISKSGAVKRLADTMTLAHFLAEYRTLRYANAYNVALDLVADVKGTYASANQATIEYLQARYNTRAIEILKGAGEYADIRLRETMTDSLAKGLTTRDTISALRDTLNSIGLGDTSKFQVETIARTQIQLALSAGRENALRDPDVEQMLWGYTYVTVGDARVREEHEQIDGVTLPKNDRFWDNNIPPNGWNCRCQVIPVFDAERELAPPSDYNGPDQDFNFNPGNLFRSIS